MESNSNGPEKIQLYGVVNACRLGMKGTRELKLKLTLKLKGKKWPFSKKKQCEVFFRSKTCA